MKGSFDELEAYIAAHSDREPDYLHRLWRATQLHLLYPRMASGHLQGRLLSLLVGMIRPKAILEIGTYSGYSALSMAESMPEGCVLHTIEQNDEQEAFTRPWLEGSPWADSIRFTIGDALEVAPQLAETFDLVFIDADKRHYCDYLQAVWPKVSVGGYILADNTLWDGHVLETLPEDSSRDDGHTAQTRGIQQFNDLVAADPRMRKIILPVRDGLTIIQKISD